MRAKRRHKKKLWSILKIIIVWTALIAFELICSAAPTAIVAAILIPLARLERGYEAFGGEWIVITGVFCGAYYFAHKRVVCKKIFKEV